MGRLLILILTLSLFGCIFEDFGFDKRMQDIDITEDTISFVNFTIVELIKDDVYFSEDNGVSIVFEGIGQDSRCPLDVVCVTAGSVTAKMELYEGESRIISTDLTIPGNNNYFRYQNTYFRLLRVDPYPEYADTPINKYTITLEIRPDGTDCQSAIIDHDHFNNPWHDEFIYEDVNIVDGKIQAKINYGGGCGTISYEMVSDGSVLESNPPQRNLLLSFKDDDNCEALISTTLCFNLSVYRLDSEGGTIQLNLDGWEEPLNYTYY